MKSINCKHCKKPCVGTKSRRFCSDSCRVAHWQKEQRKNKPKLIVRSYKKVEVISSGHELIKAVAAIMNLETMGLAGDASAWDALNQIDNRMNLVALNRKRTE